MSNQKLLLKTTLVFFQVNPFPAKIINILRAQLTIVQKTGGPTIILIYCADIFVD